MLEEGVKEPAWHEWDVPTVRQPCIQGNCNVIKLEPSTDSTFDYWLSVSTLDKGHPLLVPVKLAAYHIEALTDPKTKQRRPINSSVTLNKMDEAWWLTLSYDELVPVQTPSDAPVIGIDVGIANFLTTSRWQALRHINGQSQRATEARPGETPQQGQTQEMPGKEGHAEGEAALNQRVPRGNGLSGM